MPSSSATPSLVTAMYPHTVPLTKPAGGKRWLARARRSIPENISWSAQCPGKLQGTSGPIFLDPKTGKPYGLNFPVITIQDIVTVQKRLIDYLGIKTLLNVAGGSMAACNH